MYAIYDDKGVNYDPQEYHPIVLSDSSKFYQAKLPGDSFKKTYDEMKRRPGRVIQKSPICTCWDFTVEEYLQYGHGINVPMEYKFAILNKDNNGGDILLLQHGWVCSEFDNSQNHKWSVIKLQLIEMFSTSNKLLTDNKNKSCLPLSLSNLIQKTPINVLEIFYVKWDWNWPNQFPSPALIYPCAQEYFKIH